MDTKLTPFRFDEADTKTLNYLADTTHESRVDVMRAALRLYSETYTSSARRLARVRTALMAEIEGLQYVRDGRELTAQESVLLNWLSRVDDELGTLPGFWEPRFLETELNDYVLDAQGQPVPDPEHQKTRPADL